MEQETYRTQMELIPGLAMSLGIVKAIFKQNKQQIIHMPLTLHPYQINESTYKRLTEAHLIWQKLIINVANDSEYLTDFLGKISEKDDFITNIGKIYNKNKNQIENDYRVACSRIDYMGQDEPELVQINLMSIGLLGISDRVQKLTSIVDICKEKQGEIFYPRNQNAPFFTKAIKDCLDLCNLKDGYTLMVTQPNQFNFGDQNIFKLQMLKHKKLVLSVTMAQLLKQLKIDQNRCAYFQKKKIDCFYFRTAYAPKHFPDMTYWELLDRIYSSHSIKIPSIQLLIINTKTMQAEFKKKQVLQKYLTCQEAKQIDSLAKEIYQLRDYDSEFLRKLIQKTKKSAYVLKPNREGGGNNYFDQRATSKLEELIDSSEQNGYILMNKIHSQIRSNHFIVNFKSQQIKECTGQLSTFGAFIYKNKSIVTNEFSGNLVRLKIAQKQEGGIAIDQAAIAGFAIRKNK